MAVSKKKYRRNILGGISPSRTTGPVQEDQIRRREEKKAAIKKLKELKNKFKLCKPLVFVPGWTGEEGKAWLGPAPNIRYHISMGDTIKHLKQEENVYFITFSVEESEKCDSFLDFGEILKEKIWSKIGKTSQFDIVGHSQGGLDIIAALIQGNNYLKNVDNCFTVASPMRGVDMAEFIPLIKALFPFSKKLPPHHKKQCRNLDCDYEPIKTINKLENRTTFLERINKFYQFCGTQDMVVMKSAQLYEEALDPKILNKKRKSIKVSGATHSGRMGITFDPRVILNILNFAGK